MSPDAATRTATARLALGGIGLGALTMTAGVALVAVAIVQGSLPAWSGADDALARLTAILPGTFLIALGYGLVLRGIHMRVTLDVLRRLHGLAQPDTAPAPPTAPLTRRRQDQSTILDSPALTAEPSPRPNRTAPVTGKPFKPHPIFMARPPR